MTLQYNVLQSMFQCKHKAWLLSKEEATEQLQLHNNQITFPFSTITPQEKVAIAAWYREQSGEANTVQVLYGKSKSINIRLSSSASKTEKLLDDTRKLVDSSEPPTFFKNKHCRECPFWNHCYPKLKEKDCISLLGGISPKAITKYHSKGIFSITQLSHLFRPRRRGRTLAKGKYLWELKALALREQKIFVLQAPDLQEHDTVIYLDFEGLPDENFQYLLGAIVHQQGKEPIAFSYWADHKKDEEEQFLLLIKLLNQYPEAFIYHYGMYETAAFKQAAKQYAGSIKEVWPAIEKRMVNLLMFLRSNVYPPVYGNGLKEVVNFLGFKWSDEEASGLKSIEWRKQWEATGNDEWKEKLLKYNHDDVEALATVYHWLQQLTINANKDSVQVVSQMKKHTPFNLQGNKELGADFLYISKAAYFDYQRNKVYWRSDKSKTTSSITQSRMPASIGKGMMRWHPKKVNEVIILPKQKVCPDCGNKKLYHGHDGQTSIKQTDIKFTSTGIRQHVIEYRSGHYKCSLCRLKRRDANLRIRHYGDNLFAFITYLYINYNISNELVSRLVQEQFGIWMSQMYLVMNKHKWWKLWNPEVEYIKRTVLNSPVIHIDETSVKLDSERGYVWVFATAHSVFYHLTLTREADFLHEILKDYKGIIVTDFFPSYETLPIKQQKCLIHLIRDLNDDLFKNPFDEEYKILVSNFNKLLKSIIQTIDKYGLRTRNLKKHIKETERFLKQFVEVKYKSELANKCTKRLKKQWEGMWTFLYHDNVPWNNNNAEAAVKAFAMYRRGVNGQVSVTGMNWYLPMLSIAQTCRYRNISFLDFLRKKKGIWHNVHADILPGYLPFNQAKLYVHQLKLKKKWQWNKLVREAKLPAFIPLQPDKECKATGWKGWEDWLLK